jgi:hypothetical protein
VTLTMSLTAGLRADVPVQPDADQARSWLKAELLDPIYHENGSLLETIRAWIIEKVQEALSAVSAVGSNRAALVVVAIALITATVALLVAGPVRRARSTARLSHDVLVDDTRSASELRAASAVHADAGRFNEAVLDRFRAVLRSLEERTVLDPRPGRTADEAAREAGHRFPQHSTAFQDAGHLFDDVCYGDLAADTQSYHRVCELDDSIAASRPTAAVAQPTDADAVASL